MKSRLGAIALCAVIQFIATAQRATAQQIFATGTISAAPGTTIEVPITFTTDTNAASFEFDLVFSTNYLSAGLPMPGPANAAYFIFTNSFPFYPNQGTLRVLSLGFTPLSSGVVARVPLTVSSNAPDHNELLVVTNVSLSTAGATGVLGFGSTNVFEFLVPPAFTGINVSNNGINLELTGSTGRTYSIQAASDAALSIWSPISTNTATNGVLSLNDPTAANYPARFYRAMVVP